jgi:hypothetical protein
MGVETEVKLFGHVFFDILNLYLYLTSHKGGFLVTYNDIAGPFAGVVFGISNTIASLTGIIIPYFVAAVTKNVTNLM